MKKLMILLIIILVLLTSCQKTPKKFTGDIEEVLKLGGSYNCTAYKEGEYDLKIQIKGTKLRAEANTNNQGIIDSVGDVNDCVYGWFPKTKQGQVICITKEELKQGISLLQKSKDTNITLNCLETDIDSGIFERPEDVEFVASIGP